MRLREAAYGEDNPLTGDAYAVLGSFCAQTAEKTLHFPILSRSIDIFERSKSKALKDALAEDYEIDLRKGTIKESRKLLNQVETSEYQLAREESKPDSLQDSLRIENLSRLVARTKAEYSSQVQLDPDYAFAVKVDPVELGSIREDLPRGERLLMLYPGSSELYLFLGWNEGYLVRLVPLSREELDRLIAKTRDLCGARAAQRLWSQGKLLGWSWEHDTSAFYREEVAPLVELLHTLYTYLVEPVSEELSSAEVVSFVPSGNLYYIPWGALLDIQSDSLLFLSQALQLDRLDLCRAFKVHVPQTGGHRPEPILQAGSGRQPHGCRALFRRR